MNLKKVKSQDINAYLTETVGLERDYIGELIKSRRLAWRVAGASGLVAAIAVGAVAVMTPMQSTETVVLRVDNASGAVDVIPTVKEKAVALNELQHKRLIQDYVTARQSYDWWYLQAAYDQVRLMSSGNAWADYDSQFEGPNALHEKLKDSARIETKIVSITLQPGAGDSHAATVQFSTHQRGKNGQAEQPKYWIASLGYVINPALMAGETEQARLQNPLGFQVRSYRVDPQYVAGVTQ